MSVQTLPPEILQETSVLVKKKESLVSYNPPPKKPKKVTILGHGDLATALASVVAHNTPFKEEFEDKVFLYVDEIVNRKRLSAIINKTHENIKYLPGFYLPNNVVACSNLEKAVGKGDVLIFVTTFSEMKELCRRITETICSKVKPTAQVLTLVKSVEFNEELGRIDLSSHMISRLLKVPCSVMMGAIIPTELAKEQFCEATIGCRDKKAVTLFKMLFSSPTIQITVVEDKNTVELCGALKNMVTAGAGLIDGLELGIPTKLVVVRLGLLEMIKFVDLYFPGGKLCTFFESGGFPDLIVSCFGGTNRHFGEEFAKCDITKTVHNLLQEMSTGRNLQGPSTIFEIHRFLVYKGAEDEFPLFTSIYKIFNRQLAPEDFLDCLKKHPMNIYSPKHITFQ